VAVIQSGIVDYQVAVRIILDRMMLYSPSNLFINFHITIRDTEFATGICPLEEYVRPSLANPETIVINTNVLHCRFFSIRKVRNYNLISKQCLLEYGNIIVYTSLHPGEEL
jgi:hypothetical protein